MTNTLPTVIVIAGPTAVGKTRVAIEVASHFNTEIISADSRQCYREMKIGVARPEEAELNAVPHHFIASHSIQDNLNAAAFEKYALEKAGELFQKYPVIVMVGGTGLYIRAFLEGLDEIPVIKPGIRESIIARYEENGLVGLQEDLQKSDPDYYREGEIQNPHRIMRALEVIESTGRSILSYRSGKKADRNFHYKLFGLELPRAELTARIDARVDQMIRLGLEEEVRNLLPHKNLTALQTVGYREFFDFFSGDISREEAIEQIKQHSRQYAKRQMTWFRKMADMEWTYPDASHILNRLS